MGEPMHSPASRFSITMELQFDQPTWPKQTSVEISQSPFWIFNDGQRFVLGPRDRLSRKLLLSPTPHETAERADSTAWATMPGKPG
ncbi:hypothetical protein FSHL1_012186 [Fusarium sambucinum]